jgi:hypothetical protein
VRRRGERGTDSRDWRREKKQPRPQSLPHRAAFPHSGGESKPAPAPRVELRAAIQELEPVSAWIGRVEAARIRQPVIPADLGAGGVQPLRDRVELVDREPRMSSFRRHEWLVFGDVQFLRADAEPRAHCAHRRRAIDLLEPDDLTIKPPRFVDPAAWRENLDVVEGEVQPT